MTALALVEPTRLDALASVANHEHGLSSRAVMSMLLHGIAAGEALNEAKALLPHGEWLGWLDANVGFAVTTATSYMLVARHKEYLLGCEDVRTMQQALRKLREDGKTSWAYLTPELAAEVADYAKRCGIKVAARTFGLNYSTVHRYAHGQLPAARLHRKGTPTGQRPQSWATLRLTDEVIEALSGWLVVRFGGDDYPVRVTDAVRNDAVEALGRIVRAESG